MSSADHEESKPQGSSSLLPLIMGILIVLPILYVLSIGPVVSLCMHFGIDSAPLRGFYGPVIWLHDNTFLKEPLERWVELWGVR